MTGANAIDRVVVLNDRSVARGGATALALLSIEMLRRRAIPVTFVAGDDGENPQFADWGVPVVAMGSRSLIDAGPRAALRGLYNRQVGSHLARWIADTDTPGTVYHLHTWSQMLSPAVFSALRGVQDRLFVSAHDFFLVCPNGAYALFNSGQVCHLKPMGRACLTTPCDRRSSLQKAWRVARQAVQARTLTYRRGYPRVLAIHGAMREPLIRGGVPANVLETVPNPIRPWSTERIAAEENTELLFVGRLTEEKGPDLAARAARVAGVPLHVIGDGPLLDRLKQEHPEVRYSGRQPPDVVARLARAARALVMPSRYPEPFGLVAAEALWSGLPVIASDQALLAPDIVARGAGFACDPRDENAFAAAMRSLAVDDARTRAMSFNAFSATRDLGQTPDSWIEQILGAYVTALARGAPLPA